jgi:predicted nuclease with TOPRIM domain
MTMTIIHELELVLKALVQNALLIALVVAGIGYWRYRKELAEIRTVLINALFGELANLYEHYSYALNELPRSNSDIGELKKRFKWSKYGELHSTREISRLGFLSVTDIQLLLQLGLRIRNTDQLLDILSESIIAEGSNSVTANDLSSVAGRMKYIIRTTQQLMRGLIKKNPDLEEIMKEIENHFPPAGQAG